MNRSTRRYTVRLDGEVVRRSYGTEDLSRESASMKFARKLKAKQVGEVFAEVEKLRDGEWCLVSITEPDLPGEFERREARLVREASYGCLAGD